MTSPPQKPKNPYFSSGPCRKFTGWDYDLLRGALLGRSHRHRTAYSRIEEAIDRTHQLLQMPPDYKLALVPGSATGAMEMALWNLLGSRGVDVLSLDVFGKRWRDVLVYSLQLPDTRVFDAPFGELPDLDQLDTDRDVVFTWNATAAGVVIPHGDWIQDNRQGLTLCDATSAAFAYDLPWEKLDAVGFSWQKVLGGEAGHGMLALSPRAIEHLKSFTPPWPLPFLLNLSQRQEKDRSLKEAIFRGETLTTPSLMCVEDWLVALDWVEKLGGLPALIQKTTQNARIIWDWLETCDWLENLSSLPEARSTTSVCLKLSCPDLEARPEAERWDFIKKLCKLLEMEGVAFDIKGHGWAKPCLRIWCGPTVEKEDLEALLPWLDWGYRHLQSPQKTGS